MSRGCSKFSNSGKPATSLVFSVTISGVVKFITDLGGGGTSTDTYTFPSHTETVTLTREEFDARAYYLSGEEMEPSVDTFWLLMLCCCWKCRFAIIPSQIGTGTKDYPYHFTRVDTANPANDDSYDGTAPGGGVSTDVSDNTRAAFCRNAEEEDRTGKPLALAAGLGGWGAAFDNIFIPWSYTDSSGNNTTGTADGQFGIALPPFDNTDTQVFPTFPLESCADAPVGWSQVVYDYADVDIEIIGLTIRADWETP